MLESGGGKISGASRDLPQTQRSGEANESHAVQEKPERQTRLSAGFLDWKQMFKDVQLTEKSERQTGLSGRSPRLETNVQPTEKLERRNGAVCRAIPHKNKTLRVESDLITLRD
jgi:hypothetical protein